MQTEEKTNQLLEVVEQSGLETQTAKSLKENFLPFFEQAEEWKKKSEELVVTDVSQVREMKMAREARLALKDIRVNADKTRKALKEDSLRYGKAVQGVYNVIEFLIAPIEKHLEEQEKFAEIQEAKRKAELKSKREIDLMPYSEFVPFGLDLANMSDDDFSKTLNGAKLQLKAKIEEDQRIEAERIAKEKAEAEERERIRLENEKLRKEAEEKEIALAKERAEAEKQRRIIAEKAEAERKEAAEKLRVEQEAKAKLEAEIKAKADAEAKAKKEAEDKLAAELKAKELADKKAKAAPDKSKLLEFAKSIEALSIPDLKSEEALKILADTQTLIAKTVVYLTEKANTL